jgi:hypothetical protein
MKIYIAILNEDYLIINIIDLEGDLEGSLEDDGHDDDDDGAQ